MKTLYMQRLTLLFFIFCLSMTAHAEDVQQEIIQLQHAQAQEILPLIQPFLAENASISAEGDSIILETTAANLQQVKILIHELDIPAKQLHISVALDPGVVLQSLASNQTQPSRLTGNTTDVIKPAVAADSSLIYKTEGREVSPGIKIIKVLQDRWTMIRTGQSIPITTRVRNPDGTMTESVSHQQINQGLRIKPHLSDQEVTLYVQPFYEADNQSGPGTKLYYKQEKVTHARLGSWIGLETTSGTAIPVDKAWLKQNQLAAKPVSLIYLKIDTSPK